MAGDRLCELQTLAGALLDRSADEQRRDGKRVEKKEMTWTRLTFLPRLEAVQYSRKDDYPSYPIQRCSEELYRTRHIAYLVYVVCT